MRPRLKKNTVDHCLEMPRQKRLRLMRPRKKECPIGPDGLQLFPRMQEFVALFLVFASDFLTRIGSINQSVATEYLGKLADMNPLLAKAYVETCHCSVSFITDTTSMQLIKKWLSTERQLSDNALYNIVIGQSVIPDWRKLEALGPFDVDAPMSPEVFVEQFTKAYPGKRNVVPRHMKQGVLWLLGPGSEILNCGKFIFEVAHKIPKANQRIKGGDDCIRVLQEELGLPRFRALLVTRLIAIRHSRLYDFDRRDRGDFAEFGLWLLEGMDEQVARMATRDTWTKPAVDPLYAALVDAFPHALRIQDCHHISESLEALNLRPHSAQSLEHMLCEWRKMVVSARRSATSVRYEDYAELWKVVAPIVAMN